MSGLTLHPLKLTLRAPLSTAQGELRVREGWHVRFEAEGVVGWGEALPLPAFGTETLERCEEGLRAAGAQVQEFEATDELERMLAPLDPTPVARFAVESALLDWIGKRRGRPVAALLGGRQSGRVSVNALLSGATPGAFAEAARSARAAGFSTVKLKVGGRSVHEDVARVFAVREALGPSVRLRIDANGGWSTAQAIEALEALRPAGLELCEQPTPAAALDALAEVHAKAPCRIAADEALQVVGGVEWLLAHRACDVFVLKPMALGGLLRTVELARRARTAGLDAYVTGLIDGEVARAAAAQVASVLDTALAHGLATGSLIDEEAQTGWLTPEQGALTFPEVPGLGVEGAR